MNPTDDLDFGQTIRGFADGQKVFGRYTLRHILGRGGMGVVWLAWDETLEEQVALKFMPEMVRLDKSAIDELKRETRKSRKLTHANIVRIHDFVEDGHSAAIAMEYVDGETFSGLRVEKPNRIFEPEEIIGSIQQLVSALTYAHETEGVVHRDLKPANLMVNSRGQIKVADFGISSSISDSVSRMSMKVGSSGSPPYMSPQQIMGEPTRVTDDIYSLGATIYELLTGKPPFHRGNIYAQIKETVPPSMSQRRAELDVTVGGEIPPVWEATIARCLAKDPTERPQSAGQLLECLEGREEIPALIGDEASSQIQESPVVERPSIPPPGSNKHWILIAASAVVVLFVAGGLWFHSREPKPSQTPLRVEPASPDQQADSNRQKAENGDPEAQFKLGFAYETGEGVATDAAQAAGWFRKAAEQGHAAAQFFLGTAYRYGHGVSEDASEGVNWTRKSAEQGYDMAQRELGVAYENGEGGLTKDLAEAAAWYKKAADQGDGLAKAWLENLKSADPNQPVTVAIESSSPGVSFQVFPDSEETRTALQNLDRMRYLFALRAIAPAELMQAYRQFEAGSEVEGVTPASLDLKPGKYFVVFTEPGNTRQAIDLVVEPSKPRTLSWQAGAGIVIPANELSHANKLLDDAKKLSQKNLLYEATEQADLATILSGPTASNLFVRTDIASRLRDFDKMRELSEQVLRQNPENTNAMFNLAESHFVQKNFQKAGELFRAWSERDDVSLKDVGWFKVFLCDLKLGKAPDPAHFLELAGETPASAMSMWMRAAVLFNDGQDEEARAEVAQAKKEFSKQKNGAFLDALIEIGWLSS